MHIRFNDVRVPKENMLLGEGRGFEISQVRLGPGRIHHCMRSIGAAERALELMAKRGLTREAFGKPLANLGKNTEVIAKARIEIEAMRLMVLTPPRRWTSSATRRPRGSARSRRWCPSVCQIIDEAIQIHGATGVSQWTPLADMMYASQRTLRLADGPDEVHWHVVGRAELASCEPPRTTTPNPRTTRRLQRRRRRPRRYARHVHVSPGRGAAPWFHDGPTGSRRTRGGERCGAHHAMVPRRRAAPEQSRDRSSAP